MSIPHARLAIDIGGTFTDIVLETAPGQNISGKFLTTHSAPETAVIDGIRTLLARSGVQASSIGQVIHGTTLATNALIERRGARIALITTAGFRDSLEIAHEHRFDVSDLYMVRPEPLVPRNLRLEVNERTAADGSILRPLDEASIRSLIPTLVENRIEAVAICFLHSYINNAHEQQTAELLRAAIPSLRITQSHEICPEIREYERACTACANAYVQPVIEGYLRRLKTGIANLGIPGPLVLITSAGGLASLEIACAQPVRLVESGPAGGAILAAHISRRSGLQQSLSFDMGGTTAKLVLIDNGQPLFSRHLEVAREHRFLKGSGIPLRIPAIDLVEIGAGGGSLAQIDALGRVTVGPESSGSEPGPAAYGHGGTRPAVTDADLLLGKIEPADFAGSQIPLQPELAQQALLQHVGTPAGLDLTGAALAVTEVVDENMANAARVHATDNGQELEGRTMIAFGGAAPLHAARVAQKLNIDTVIIPAGAGVGSAHGFLLAPASYEAVRTRYMTLRAFKPETINALFSAMYDEALAIIEQASPSNAPLSQRRTVYMRYRGQGHEVAVALPAEDFDAHSATQLQKLFEAAYHRHFGRIIPAMEAECLTWTLTLSRPSTTVFDSLEETVEKAGGTANFTLAPDPATPLRTQTLVDPVSTRHHTAAVFSRTQLTVGDWFDGPAIVTETETSTTVPANFRAHIDAHSNLVLNRMP